MARRRHRDARWFRNGSRCWSILSLPGIAWLVLFFLAPLYVVLAIVFGAVDPMFRTPTPIWNPVHWRAGQFTYVLDRIFGSDGVFGPALLRTAVYVVAGQRAVRGGRVPGGLLRRAARRRGARG